MAKGFGTIKPKRKYSDRDYINLLYKLIKLATDNSQKPQAVYTLLRLNLDILDNKFGLLLSEWEKAKLSAAPLKFKRDVASFIVNLSNLIKDFPHSNKIHIEIAITGYEIALTAFNREEFPKEWADTQNNLGTAYLYRISGNRPQNLDNAILKFQNALIVRNRNSFPEQWAITQINLGAAYTEQIHGNIFENREQAIKAYENALTVLTKEKNPRYWALAYNNLGNAYCQRIKGDTNKNIEQAIVYYKNALEIFKFDRFPEDWAMTKNNLGLAYEKLNSGKPSINLELAIANYESALKIYTYELFPKDWAMLQNNLGNAYCERTEGDRSVNIKKAIAAYKSALKVYTYEAFPLEWSQVQNDLGTACIVEGQIIQGLHIDYERIDESFYISAINEAIGCFRLALKVRTTTTNPAQCYQTACNLGHTGFLTGYLIADYWREAIEGYGIAIEAVETSRSWVNSESRRQEILEQSIGIYENMVQACINGGQIEKAFEYSERSRSKLLVDLMASYNLFEGDEIPPKLQELLQQYEELQQQIDQERQSHKSENSRSDTRAIWEERNQKIIFLETQKQQVWENIRREDPVLAGEIQVNPLKLSEIQKLIDQTNTAILSFYTTNSDTHIFVVQQNKITLHTCIGQGLDILQGWIEQNWLLPYRDEPKKWQTQINSILRELAERLQISELISEHLQGIEELILVPHLLLHQIPFTALPTGEYQEYLGDKFLIRYTPSCQILEFCQQRDTVDKMSLQYGTVEDAEDNLPCARFEGEKLAQIYNIPRENRLIGSNQATTKNYRQLAQQVQVLHSCHHAESRLDNPLESQLKLAHGSSITLGQLMTPSWRFPQLVEVFLSCCETNLGTPSLTDDILTLSTGFLCAGARSVVSTLWSVNDLATALFSIFYYQQRQEGRNRPEALQKAQIQLREFRKIDLNKIFQEVEAREKELIVNRKKYPSGSIEHEQWKLEYNMYAKLNRQFKEIENSTQQFPFSDPHYWAAFICHGLR
ncbi:CHAT domain-containing protein [Desmonostoc muscorum LEGE 12446]|nr:CHAT domain-containing protein [Desmonostoc muscorum]MCF2145939.1 CHAT domain-containing protein [Desmonostoc muscorum LEGE 12446]